MINFFYLVLVYLIVIYSTILISNKFNIYDIPNNRKIHGENVVNTAGISLYIFLLIIVSIYEYSYEIELIISYGIFLVIFGFIDDRISMHASIKLVCIIFPSIFLILNGFELKDLGYYEYIGTLSLGKFSIIFTLLSVGLLINSYNYVDGIDGLLSSLTLSTIIYIVFLIDNNNVINLLSLFTIPLIINLIFNLFPRSSGLKIFLGDCGSLFLGFFISFLIIYIYKFEKIHPSYLIWACWYPIYDFLYVTSKRLLDKKNFYEADNNHLHHIILKYFKNNQKKALVLINIINIFILIVGYQVAENIGKIYSLILFIFLYFVFWVIRKRTDYV